MDGSKLAELWAYGPYVWGAYAACALALAAELVSLKMLKRHTAETLDEAQLLAALARRERESSPPSGPASAPGASRSPDGGSR